MLMISFLAILVLLVLLTGVRIANQYERAVVFRLGKYARTSGRVFICSFPSSSGNGRSTCSR